MTDKNEENSFDTAELREQALASEERLRAAEAASGFGTFEMAPVSEALSLSPQAAVLFGLDATKAVTSLSSCEHVIFIDDMLKIRAALKAAKETGSFQAEFRVKHADGSLRWLAGKGQATSVGEDGSTAPLRGAFYEITERKTLDARLLALNETLETRLVLLREEARALELLNQIGVAVAAELDLEKLVQRVTDAGVELSHAEFGAFFYNVSKESGESYTLYALSGAPREAFEKFPMPRNTAIFDPTFSRCWPDAFRRHS